MSNRIDVEVTQSIRPTVNDELLIAGTCAEISSEVLDNFPEAFVVTETTQAHPSQEEPTPPAPNIAERSEGHEVQRPMRSASIAQWRKYAESLGIVTTGLAKKDIIAATETVQGDRDEE